ncbi:MAG: threonine/serine exporter family protein [Herbinix sp.]|nr:threonine/serine exporter family protein [Herbinix sp.]
MNYKTLFKTAMLAGEIMAQSGAETFRVEDTMIRILKTSNLQGVQVYAATTGVMATLSDPNIEPISEVLRINNRVNNLSRINEVNQISRDICDGMISIEEAYDKLILARNKQTYSRFIIAIATIVSTGGFAGLFGGSIIDCIIAAINGLIIVMIGKILGKRVESYFMIDAAKSFSIAAITMLCTVFINNINSEIIIIGSIMPLVPGIPITNAIRDTLQGDYMSGTARAVEAFVISVGITIGIGFGMGFFNLLERMFVL